MAHIILLQGNKYLSETQPQGVIFQGFSAERKCCTNKLQPVIAPVCMFCEKVSWFYAAYLGYNGNMLFLV